MVCVVVAVRILWTLRILYRWRLHVLDKEFTWAVIWRLVSNLTPRLHTDSFCTDTDAFPIMMLSSLNFASWATEPKSLISVFFQHSVWSCFQSSTAELPQYMSGFYWQLRQQLFLRRGWWTHIFVCRPLLQTAYMWSSRPCFLTILPNGSMYSRKRIWPNTDPCGTGQCITVGGEHDPSICTHCIRSER